MALNESLVAQYQATSDKSVLESILRSNEGLVYRVAKRYAQPCYGLELDDLFCEGRIGLIEAVKKYDPAQGTRFSTYATSTIHGYIQHYIRDKHPLIAIPTHIQEQANRLKKILTVEGLDSNLTPQELHSKTQIPYSQCEKLIEAYRAVVTVTSYNQPTSESGTQELVDILCKEKADLDIDTKRLTCKAIISEFMTGKVTTIALSRKYGLETADIKNLIENRHLFGFMT